MKNVLKKCYGLSKKKLKTEKCAWKKHCGASKKKVEN